ncbi:hypothetical protein [Paenibacillus abyssi]|uniref:Uncharacterized protein n=1 Tax=Paenibacillus abyssi TaxID=1340531 RepID=A0A917FYV3_9BACL|nr:hypothetical protein [Paenibacillus abyssi]GGG14588.1 hypothetical protein GCM10010916_34370 [Paenibacillus abyssi]
MSDKTPDWYQKLKGEPLVEKTFTVDSIRRIEQKRAEWEKRGKARTNHIRRVFVMCAASILLVLLLGISLEHDRLGKWVSDIGSTWSTEPGSITPPAGKPGPDAVPPDTIGPDTAEPEPFDPDQTETDNQTQKPDPTQTDGRVHVKRMDGLLMEYLPFNTEEVQSISLWNNRIGEEIIIPDEREYVITQALNWLDIAKARVEEAAGSEPDLKLRFHLKNHVYAIPYNPDNNALDLGGGQYYADDRTLLLIKSLMDPNSRLAVLDQTLEQARVPAEDGSSDESKLPDWEKLKIDGKDYNSWEMELKGMAFDSETLYYDSVIERVDGVREYGQGRIIQLSRLIVFLNSDYKTTDGVGVGLSEEEVLQLLGMPNHRTQTCWSYATGDYLTFHLYFEAGFVKMMALSQPA